MREKNMERRAHARHRSCDMEGRAQRLDDQCEGRGDGRGRSRRRRTGRARSAEKRSRFEESSRRGGRQERKEEEEEVRIRWREGQRKGREEKKEGRQYQGVKGESGQRFVRRPGKDRAGSRPRLQKEDCQESQEVDRRKKSQEEEKEEERQRLQQVQRPERREFRFQQRQPSRERPGQGGVVRGGQFCEEDCRGVPRHLVRSLGQRLPRLPAEFPGAGLGPDGVQRAAPCRAILPHPDAGQDERSNGPGIPDHCIYDRLDHTRSNRGGGRHGMPEVEISHVDSCRGALLREPETRTGPSRQNSSGKFGGDARSSSSSQGRKKGVRQSCHESRMARKWPRKSPRRQRQRWERKERKRQRWERKEPRQRRGRRWPESRIEEREESPQRGTRQRRGEKRKKEECKTPLWEEKRPRAADSNRREEKETGTPIREERSQREESTGTPSWEEERQKEEDRRLERKEGTPVGEKEEAERRGSHAPIGEKTPKLGDKERSKGVRGLEDLDLDLPEEKEAIVLGGADIVAKKKVRFLRQGQFLRSGVKNILEKNLLQEFSLQEVGYVLFQCMTYCCKPEPMAEKLEVHDLDEGSLAYAARDDPTLKTWECSTTLALQHLSGLEGSRLAELRCDPAEKESVRRQLKRFDIWEEKFIVDGFERFFETKNIDYSGEEVRLAQKLNWRAVENSLPEGVGNLELASFCTKGTKAYVENFEEYLIPEEERRYLKPPKVMVEDGQWDLLAEGLIRRNICTAIPLAEVYHLEGQPLLNGLFAVGKGEYVDSVETQRLIMNLQPVNLLCRELKADISTLPSLANFGLMTMGEDDACLVSSEDIRCFFYLFRTPKSWRRYMGFNRILSPHLVPSEHAGKPCVLAATVLPMGFANSVGIAQHVHRNVIGWANQGGEQGVGPEGEIRKDKGFPSSSTRFRIYLDNFDQLEVVDAKLASLIQGTPSAQVLAVRQTYERLNLPRHPKKGVARELRAEVQGALVLGDLGIAMPKPQKLVQYMRLAMELLSKGECKLRELQVVCGGFVYFTGFRRPLLCALNGVWLFMEEFKSYPPVVRLPLPDVVVTELVRFLCLVPLAQLCFTPKIQGTVTCSDASMTGGGMCASVGLTNYGRMACDTNIRGDIPEAEDMVQVLTVGMFDGLGALRVACDALGLPMLGHISIEQDPKARRVVEAFFPDSTFHEDVTSINEDLVRQWALKYSNAAVVLLGGGPPCQGVSGLNADKRGALKDHRSKLFAEVPRVFELLKKEFFWAQVQMLMESVASMDPQDRHVMSESVQLTPWRVDSSGIAICRRPRLYWFSWEVEEGEGVQLHHPDESWDYGEILLWGAVDNSKLLQPGWTLCGEKLPTFTTARPSSTPGRKPAGLDHCTPEEKSRWKEDEHRFPPYQYSYHCGLVNKRGEWRLPDIQEREVGMGFPVNYTRMCLPKGEQKGRDFENARLTLVGNSWQVGVICWLLGQLFHPLGLCEAVTPQRVIDLLTPGTGPRLQHLLLRPPLCQPRQAPKPDPQGKLVKKLMGIASIKGEDLLLQGSSEQSVKFHRLRASIPSGLWKWKDLAGWQWKGNQEHINGLEMRAVLATLKWWTKKKKVRSSRILHLVDSLVCLHALSRGRTSSRKLRRTLMRINSLILSADLHPIWAYVHTSQNPADRPSRRVKFMKRKWGSWAST